jgi:Tfp pilus assembly protein PilV
MTQWRRLINSQKGLTVTELLVAVTFSLFLTMGVYAFSSFMNNAQYEYQSNVELTNDARQIVDRLVWGQKLTTSANRRGIAEAVTGTIVSPTQFSYNDVNGTVHTVRLNNGNIEYQRGTGQTWNTLLDPNGALAYDPSKYTTSISFTQPATANSVLLKVSVGKSILGRWYYGSASTEVFYRNA